MAETVTILGARGSAPVSGAEFSRYGGATTCVLLRLAGEAIVLDAGTGLLKIAEKLGEGESRLTLLLTHGHADHLIGLPMCPLSFDKRCVIDIYAARQGENDACAALKTLMSPPLWPVGPEELPAKFSFHELYGETNLGNVRVRAIQGMHSGGVTLLRLEGAGKSVVFMTDCTICDANDEELLQFAARCELLLCDGQYSDSDMETKGFYGHSAWTRAAAFGKRCGALQTRIVHHDPQRTDDELDAACGKLKRINARCGFAFEGEELCL